MSTDDRYSATRYVSVRELADRAERPSEALRRIEAHLIGEVARAVAFAGKRWVDWPALTIREDSHFGPTLSLTAEVTTRA